MRRPLILRSTHLVRLLVVVALLGTLMAGASLRPSRSTAQDDAAIAESAGATPLLDVVLDPMPIAPSFIRLIRITMQPGSSIPMRSHPGPKIDRVEAGTLTAVVRDEGNTAAVSIAGADQVSVAAGDEVALAAGDAIVLPVDTFYAFRNAGTEPVVLLSTIMLPAGHQRPPGITYADGEPAADAYDGVTNQILGDGVATALPTSPGRFTVDEVTVTPDQPLAASSSVTLLSNRMNGVEIAIDSGRVQVSRTVAPGPQRDADPESAFTLISGDGVFFPEGYDEITIPEGALTFTRLTLTGGDTVDSGASTGVSSGVEGTPVPSGAGAISILTVPAITSNPDSTPLPASSRPPRGASAEDPAEEGASEPTEVATETVEETDPSEDTGSGSIGGFPIGTTVATVDVGVNVRLEPSATAEVVLQVDAAGSQFVVIGEPVEAEDFTWVEVQSMDDPSVIGWIASDFLEAV